MTFHLFFFFSLIRSVHSDRSKRCVYPCVVFKSDWECVIYTLDPFRRIVFYPRVETNLIYFLLSLSLRLPPLARPVVFRMCSSFVVNPAKTFQYSFVLRTTRAKSFHFVPAPTNCYMMLPNAATSSSPQCRTHALSVQRSNFDLEWNRSETDGADDAPTGWKD